MRRIRVVVMLAAMLFAFGACDALGRKDESGRKPEAKPAAEQKGERVPIRSETSEVVRAAAKLPDGAPYVGPSFTFKARFSMRPEDGRLQSWQLKVVWLRDNGTDELERVPVIDLKLRGGTAVELNLPRGTLDVNAELLRVRRENGRLEDFVPWFTTLTNSSGDVLDMGEQVFETTGLGAQLGKLMPEWQVTEHRGGDGKHLRDYRGKWVLLHIWGYWCKFCVGDSLPRLLDFYARHGDLRDRFEIIAFHDESVLTLAALDQKLEEAAVVEKLWGGRALPFPVLLAGERKTVERWRPRVFPTVCLIDPEGRLVQIGATEHDLLAKIAPQRAKEEPAPVPGGA